MILLYSGRIQNKFRLSILFRNHLKGTITAVSKMLPNLLFLNESQENSPIYKREKSYKVDSTNELCLATVLTALRAHRIDTFFYIFTQYMLWLKENSVSGLIMKAL